MSKRQVDINLDLKSADKVLDKMDKLIERFEKLNQVMGAGPTGGAGGGGGRGGRGSQPPRSPKAPPVQAWDKKLMSLLATTRVGAGGFMPLLGQIGKVFGPAGMLVTSVATVAKQMADAAREASERATELTNTRHRLGGSLGPGATNIGYVAGGDAGSIADLGNKIAEAIQTNPYVGGIAGQHGVRDIPGPYGTLDRAKLMEDFVRMLRKMPEDQARRVIREAGVPELGRMLPSEMSDRQFDSMFPGRNRVADATQRINDMMENERRQAQAGGDRYGTLNPLHRQFQIMELIWNKVQNSIYGGLDQIGGKDDKKAERDALDRNTDAIKENTAYRNGSRGGGPQTDGAVPMSWKYKQFEDAMANEQIRLGGLVL